MIITDNHLKNNSRFFDGKRAALQCISSALTSAEQVRIATAYFEGSGFQALQNVLSGKKVKLLVGREEGGEDSLREVLQEFVNELSYGHRIHQSWTPATSIIMPNFILRIKRPQWLPPQIFLITVFA
jgi:hypothetical protein